MLILFYILTLVYGSSVIESHNILKFTNKSDSTKDVILQQGFKDIISYITTEKYQKNITIKGGDAQNNGSIYNHTDVKNPFNGTLLLCYLIGTSDTSKNIANFNS